MITHPCGKAAKALDDAGINYEIHVVAGFKNLPFSRRGKREQIIALTGQPDVPVLVGDNDLVIVGSREIINWAHTQRG